MWTNLREITQAERVCTPASRTRRLFLRHTIIIRLNSMPLLDSSFRSIQALFYLSCTISNKLLLGNGCLAYMTAPYFSRFSLPPRLLQTMHGVPQGESAW